MARSPQTARSNSDRVLSRRVLVAIGGDLTSALSKIVWMHEIPILEEVWGEGKVRTVDASALDEGYTTKISPNLTPHNKQQDKIEKPSETAGIDFVFVGDARTEYERLATLYGRHTENSMTYVEYVYGRFNEGRFERLLGLADFDDMPDAQLRQVAIEHGHLPIVSRDSTPEERKAEATARRELFTMGREQLLKLVTELVGSFA